MFEKVLSRPDGDAIRAHLSFNRPSDEPDAVKGSEECWLLALGHDVNGAPGRTHGGFHAAVIDQVSGSTAHHARPLPTPPATATMTVDYKAEVRTPGVVLVRAWITELQGRKAWVRTVIEDSDGRACSVGRTLFVYPREQPTKL